MAFNFMSALPHIGSAIQSGAGIASLFSKRDATSEIPVLQPMVDALHASQTYSEASADPTHPFAKNLAALLEGEQRRDMVTALKRIMIANRRASARGDVGFGVNPERRDEARSQALLKAFSEAKDRARLMASQQLSATAGQHRQTASAYGPLVNVFGQYADTNRANRAGGIEAIGELFKSIPGLFPQSSGGPTSLPSQIAPQRLSRHRFRLCRRLLRYSKASHRPTRSPSRLTRTSIDECSRSHHRASDKPHV